MTYDEIAELLGAAVDEFDAGGSADRLAGKVRDLVSELRKLDE